MRYSWDLKRAAYKLWDPRAGLSFMACKMGTIDASRIGAPGCNIEASTPVLFIYFYFYCLAALGLRCCTWAFSSCHEQGLLFIAVHGLLIAVASLVAEHRLWVHGPQQLWHVGSVVVACGLPGLVALWHVESSWTRA